MASNYRPPPNTISISTELAQEDLDDETFKTLLNVEIMLKPFCERKDFSSERQIQLWDAIRKKLSLTKVFLKANGWLEATVVEHILALEKRQYVIETLLEKNPVGNAETKNIKRLFPKLSAELQGKLLLEEVFTKEEVASLLLLVDPDEALAWFLCLGYKTLDESQSVEFLLNLFEEKSIFRRAYFLMPYLASEHKPLVELLLRKGGGKRNFTLLAESIFDNSNIRLYESESLQLAFQAGNLDPHSLNAHLIRNPYFDYIEYRKATGDTQDFDLMVKHCFRDDRPRICGSMTREGMITNSSWYSSANFRGSQETAYYVEYLPAYQEVVAGRIPRYSPREANLLNREDAKRKKFHTSLSYDHSKVGEMLLGGYAMPAAGTFIAKEMKGANASSWMLFFKLIDASNASLESFVKTVKALTN